MNLSRKWLSDYTDIKASSKEYADKMTMSGSKVELTHEPSEGIKNVVVGRVTAIERHPDSDHMWVCQLDVGQAELVQIVTGAQNVRQGDLVPAALHKSLLPCGKKIEKGKPPRRCVGRYALLAGGAESRQARFPLWVGGRHPHPAGGLQAGRRCRGPHRRRRQHRRVRDHEQQAGLPVDDRSGPGERRHLRHGAAHRGAGRQGKRRRYPGARVHRDQESPTSARVIPPG